MKEKPKLPFLKPSVLAMFQFNPSRMDSPDPPMCNLYSQTKSQDAMRHVFDHIVEEGDAFEDLTGNLPPMTGIYPDYAAPIIRHGPSGGWQLATARWGMPTPPPVLEGKRTDPGVTNIRNVASPHWRRWLGIENRCLVPFTSFSEIDRRPRVVSRMLWKFPGGVLRACEGWVSQAARSRDIGSRG